MAIFNPRLLTPPREKEEIYPYRRVWRSITIEGGILMGIAVGLYIAIEILGINIPSSLYRIVALLIALLPAILWLLFSWWQEYSVPQPRSRLLTVAIISGLAANAIGVPLINEFFQVDKWLPLSSAIDRILGYTFTVGLVQEFLKYLVIRYTVWPNQFRIRLDGIAYGAAAAIGYMTVLNLHFVASNTATPDVVAARIFATFALNLVTSIIVGYGLSEVRFSNSLPLLLTLMIALSAFITGVAVPVRAGLVNAPLSLEVSMPRALFGLGFSVILLIAPCFVLSFLFDSAERRAQEADRLQED
ncbi:MAG: PrsW family intramembrane metalloprotease [Anaerolineae bacterium]|nr:PrsW family intramembrane metalloprotease [Anaerolineae bacterium]